MEKRKHLKPIVVFIFFIVFFSGVSFTTEMLLGTPQSSINGQKAIILAVDHEESAKIFDSISINITYTFGCGATPLYINHRFNYLERTLELVLWRPPGINLCIYVIRSISYEVSFPRTGKWAIKINVENGGPITNISIWS